MPYLGNQHIVGDSVNNFKVLDDISTYTETFDGSLSSVVSTSAETIKVLNHRFLQGQRVTYNNGGGSNIGGLTSGTAYYVIYDTAHTIKLATSALNAGSLTAINLNAVGGGTSHTLNASFDGVNKRFRITHGGGNRARFSQATQLSIAINNVIQKPNNDASNFSEGYAIEIRNVIVFQTAPTSDDIFFGTLLGETLGTFDIKNHKIDNYTGDGSTTLYNLSQNVPNNESLLVSLNGVIQHPSSGGVTRSYGLVSGTTNRLQFTTAPALGVEIQIRHLGFAGANSSDVTGFYGRTGNVGLTAGDHITTGDITSRNINSSGIITATSFVGSGANLTGIDATSVKDSGGNVKIQAQASGAVYTGIHTFSSGAEVGSNIKLGNAGVVTATTFKGDGDFVELDVDGHTNLDNLSVAGVATFAGNLNVGGVLTYEDVKNVDSVGLGTFRDGLIVNTGTATTALLVQGDARVTGILTVGTGSLKITDRDIHAVGVVTGSNFKTGSTNVHSVGVEAAGINVTGADTPIGTGSTIYNSGAAVFTGVVTATTFSGSGADLTSLPSGQLTGALPAISGANLTGIDAGKEVYGFTGIGNSLSLTTTNNGADNIDNATYVAFEENFIGPSGISFSINTSGNLIMSV